jgi:hypothetical protein
MAVLAATDMHHYRIGRGRRINWPVVVGLDGGGVVDRLLRRYWIIGRVVRLGLAERESDQKTT